MDFTSISAQLVQCDATGKSNSLVSCDLCDLIGTVNLIFGYAFAFLAAATVLMLIVGGIRYIVASGNQQMIEQAKKTIQFAIIGLVVVILSFVIVGSILNILGFKNDPFGQVACDLSFAGTTGGGPGGGALPPGPPPGRPGQEPVGPGATGQWSDLINQKARENNIEPCALQSVVQRESGGKADAIGHDAHNGHGDPLTGDEPRHGLDWNHSHGIGLTQVTIFPLEHTYGQWQDSNTPSRKIGSTWYTVSDLLDPGENMTAGAEYLAFCNNKCDGDYQCSFGCYNGAGTDSGYAQAVNSMYEQCLKENNANSNQNKP